MRQERMRVFETETGRVERTIGGDREKDESISEDPRERMVGREDLKVRRSVEHRQSGGI